MAVHTASLRNIKEGQCGRITLQGLAFIRSKVEDFRAEASCGLTNVVYNRATVAAVLRRVCGADTVGSYHNILSHVEVARGWILGLLMNWSEEFLREK